MCQTFLRLTIEPSEIWNDAIAMMYQKVEKDVSGVAESDENVILDWRVGHDAEGKEERKLQAHSTKIHR